MTKEEFEALIPFDQDVQSILGRVCFQCIKIASLLRANGQEIPTKAEAEQAAVLYWLLTQRVVHGPETWRVQAEQALQDIKEKHQASHDLRQEATSQESSPSTNTTPSSG